MKIPLLLVMLAGLPAPKAWAEAGIGIGAAAGPRPAVSVQLEATPRAAYHVTAHFGDDVAALTADYQRLMVPTFGRGAGWQLAVYAGGGLAGESTHDTAGEAYRLRLPVGVQWDELALRLSAFAEAAATLGPLPDTSLGGVVTGGLRARF